MLSFFCKQHKLKNTNISQVYVPKIPIVKKTAPNIKNPKPNELSPATVETIGFFKMWTCGIFMVFRILVVFECSEFFFGYFGFMRNVWNFWNVDVHILFQNFAIVLGARHFE